MGTDYCWLDDVVGVDLAALGRALSSGIAGANFSPVEDATAAVALVTAA